jgi:hypothetical protein
MWLESERAEKRLVEALHIEFQQNLTLAHGKHGKNKQCCFCCENNESDNKNFPHSIESLKCKTLCMCSSPQNRVVQRLHAGRSGVRIPTGTRNLFLLQNRAQPAVFPQLKQSGPKADHSHPSSALVSMGGAKSPFSLYAFMMCTGPILPYLSKNICVC